MCNIWKKNLTPYVNSECPNQLVQPDILIRSSVFVDTQYLMIQKVGKRDPTGILIVLLTVIAYIWHFLMAFS